MRTRLLGWVEWLSSRYWFLPALLALVGVLLAEAVLAFDQGVSGTVGLQLPWLGGIERADGARTLLSTVAGSIITVAGVVFSMTMVSMSLASQQFGPRLVGNFMRDRGNQLVLGTFVGTFVYCLLVLRTVRSADPVAEMSAFVPRVSLAVAVLLTLLSLGMLLYFIHHTAESIQVSYVLAGVVNPLRKQILELPEALLETDGAADEPSVGVLPEDFHQRAVTVRATTDGYVQSIDRSGLVALAEEHDVLLRLHHLPGGLLLLGSPLADVYPGGTPDGLAERIEANYLVGVARTASQDPWFLFDQLLEVAVRALSPGANDPFTAISCIDRIAEALNLLSRRQLPSASVRDSEGVLRVVMPRLELAPLVQHLFAGLRAYGAGDPLVAVHLMVTLRKLQVSGGSEALFQAAEREVGHMLESGFERLETADYENLIAVSRRS